MNTSGFYPLTLTEKTREYDQIHTLRFVPDEPVSFIPGQYVHLLAPASPPGPENVRHLSLASSPDEPFLQFTLDLAPTSDYKRRLAALGRGGKAHLFKVKGEFVLGESPASRVVFWAGGLGITPVRSLVRQIQVGGLPVQWCLVHVARGDYLYEDEFRTLGGTQTRIRHAEVEGEVFRRMELWPNARHYVSGSARFVDGVSALLKARGVPDAGLRLENFR